MEQVNLNNLDSDSIPEYRLTRERKFWYPRNSAIKRAKAHEELERKIAAAKADGRDEGSVDSTFLRKGTKEFEDFERRNGIDKEPIPVNGLLMEQHPHTVYADGSVTEASSEGWLRVQRHKCSCCDTRVKM